MVAAQAKSKITALREYKVMMPTSTSHPLL
jgi:hypothetical protein